MSILIKGMAMPASCQKCVCSDDGGRYCNAAHEFIPMMGRPSFCPLVEIPPHGALRCGKVGQAEGGGRMNCTNCINKGQICLLCEGQFYAQPVKKPDRKPSAWEKRWIRWVKKNER